MSDQASPSGARPDWKQRLIMECVRDDFPLPGPVPSGLRAELVEAGWLRADAHQLTPAGLAALEGA